MSEHKPMPGDSKERVAFDLMAYIAERDIKGSGQAVQDTEAHFLRLYSECLRITSGARPPVQ